VRGGVVHLRGTVLGIEDVENAEELRAKGLEVRGEPEDQGWGITTTLVLPGEVEVMLYEPRHPTAI